ncbi:hypothetical protein SPFL3102_00518 [Sporomusaceae bacterium FL31]|nr:hypothetical protein SPFL3101_01554 [Sporomusaceae bacterium FL31]GCE32722.1 hypothetical protein SPFL3102_00518 [Sporomusaceae bacterium]
MNIRPVDLQIIIPKSTEVGKTQAFMNQQSLIQQQYSEEKNQKIADQRLQQVQETFKNEGGKIQRDESYREKQKNPHKGNHKKEAKEPELESDEGAEHHNLLGKENLRGQFIDIKT